jgi:hypothetical protein
MFCPLHVADGYRYRLLVIGSATLPLRVRYKMVEGLSLRVERELAET